MFDYLIKNATLVDGLGGAPKAGDLAIKDGVIEDRHHFWSSQGDH